MKFEAVKQTLVSEQEIQIAQMIKEFIVDSKPQNLDLLGYYDMTISNISKAMLCPTNDHTFWLLSEDSSCLGFACSNICTDVDNSRCFYTYIGYIKSELRNRVIVKDCIKILKETAKKEGCKYMIYPTNRDPKVMKRFLGRNTTDYCTLLKESI